MILVYYTTTWLSLMKNIALIWYIWHIKKWPKFKNSKMAPSSGVKIPRWTVVYKKDFFTTDRTFLQELILQVSTL